MTNHTLIRAGFDTVEYSVQGAIPEAFLEQVEAAKVKAVATRKPTPFSYGDCSFLVYPNGGQGGFTYMISTGPYGAIIKMRGIGSKDDYCAHVKLSSIGLATKGLSKLKLECDVFFKEIKSVINKENTRVSRLDYALDFYAPNFILSADNIVTHAKRTKADTFERQTTGDKVGYLRVGKMPRAQVCIYNKWGEVSSTGKLAWQDIWSTSLKQAGLIPQTHHWWRIEFRLGKDAIDRLVKPRLWGRVFPAINNGFLDLADKISLRAKSGDSNRSRWPLDPIWASAIWHLQNEFESFAPVQISQETKKMIVENHLAGLEAQSDGLSLTIAAAYDVSQENLEGFIAKLASDSGARLMGRENIEEELKARKERQALLYDY